jgi:BirA family biotin operon repressor/biotin-[acetyl-CoA-carboxylase] ligase
MYIHLDTIDSTQDYAKQHYLSFEKDQITCVWAEEQTKGRGLYDKQWISPRGVNLYATFYFQLAFKTFELLTIGQIMACSIASILSQKGLDPRIKWPNDLQLEGKKIAGILCETIETNGKTHLFVGIGLNVNMEQKQLVLIDQPATSLKVETNRIWNKQELLQTLYETFKEDVKKFAKEGFFPFQKIINELLAYKGKQVIYKQGNQSWEGICHSISSNGGLNLLLIDPPNQIVTLFSGELIDVINRSG